MSWAPGSQIRGHGPGVTALLCLAAMKLLTALASVNQGVCTNRRRSQRLCEVENIAKLKGKHKYCMEVLDQRRQQVQGAGPPCEGGASSRRQERGRGHGRRAGPAAGASGGGGASSRCQERGAGPWKEGWASSRLQRRGRGHLRRGTQV